MKDLTKRYEACKNAVENGKRNLAVAEKELEINTTSYTELLAGAKEKFGIKDYDDLVKKKEILEVEIEKELNDIEAKLKAGGLL
jgi:hypothetical protein